MSMLQDIQDAAIDSRAEIAPLLRRCQVLAYRLDQDELKNWVHHELNGYPKQVPLPSYREICLSLTGTFLGPFGSRLQGVPIAPAALPKKLAELVKKHPLPAPIAEYEALAESGKELQIALSGDALLAIGHNVYQEGFGCVSATHDMPPARLKGLIDTVRNRVLAFVLELGKLGVDFPYHGPAAPQDVPRDTVSQVFNTYILGSNSTIALGDNAVAQSINALVPQDLESLASFLRTQNIDESDVSELKEALATDPTPTDKAALGRQVSAWIGKMAGKAASGAWKVTVDAGVKVLSAAILKHYGLG